MIESAEVDILMADSSSKIRDLQLRTLTAIDLTYRPGASTSFQRQNIVVEEYLEPLERATKAFGTMAFFVFPGILNFPPNARWGGVAKAHMDAAKEIRIMRDKVHFENLWEEYTTSAAVVRRLEKSVAAQENSIISLTFNATAKTARAGLELARGIGRGVERVVGKSLDNTRDVALKVGDVAMVVTQESGSTVRQGIKSGEKIVTNLTDEAGKTVRSGLYVWGIVAAAVAGLILLTFGPAVVQVARKKVG